MPGAPAGAGRARPGASADAVGDTVDLACAPSDWLGEEVVTLARHLADDTYAMLRLIGEIDARDAYVLWGSLSCAAWLHRHDDSDAIARRQHRERAVSWRTEPDGMVVITARLEPSVAGAVCAVIDRRVMGAPMGTAPGDETRRSLAQQRADALVGMATTASGTRAHGRAGSEAEPDEPAGRIDTELIVHVTADGNHLPDGTPLGDHAVTELLPDAFVSLLLHDAERRPIDASPRRRFPSRRQRRVVDARYDECTEPGCTATEFLEYDHVEAFDPAHPNTVVANLQRLCGPHNRAKYERSRASRRTQDRPTVSKAP